MIVRTAPGTMTHKEYHLMTERNAAPRVGEFVTEPPAPKATAPRRNDEFGFESMTYLAQSKPGQPLLAATHVPSLRIKALRQYKTEPFVTEHGHVDVQMRDSAVEEDGVRYGDVYLTWIEND